MIYGNHVGVITENAAWNSDGLNQKRVSGRKGGSSALTHYGCRIYGLNDKFQEEWQKGDCPGSLQDLQDKEVDDGSAGAMT